MSTDALLQRVSQLTASLTGRPEDVLPVCALLEELLRARPGVRGTHLQALIRSALPLVDRQVSEALRDVARAQQAFEANPMSPAFDAVRFVNSATLVLRSLSAPAPAAAVPTSAAPAAAVTASIDAEEATVEDRRMLFLVLLVAFALVTAVIAVVALLSLPDERSTRSVSRGVVVEPDDEPVAEPPAATAASTESRAATTAEQAQPASAPASAPVTAQEASTARPTLHMRGEIVLRGSGDPKAVAAELRQALGLPPEPAEP